MQREIVEVCPNCEAENIQEWYIEKDGYIGKCKECGEYMFLCDECLHADDNPSQKCDWHQEGNMSVCFRGKYKMKED